METMETIALIIHMLIWGLITAFFIACIFLIFHPNSSDDPMSLVSKVLAYGALVITCAFFAFCSADCFYIVAKKLFANPKPSNPIELYIEGKEYIQYQDTTHFCNANDKNSPCFRSRIRVGKKASKDDICEDCGKSFRRHDTHEEQRYFNSLSSTDYSISYSSVFNLKQIIITVKSVFYAYANTNLLKLYYYEQKQEKCSSNSTTDVCCLCNGL